MKFCRSVPAPMSSKELQCFSQQELPFLSMGNSPDMHRNSLLTSTSVCNLGENEHWSWKILAGGERQENGLSQGATPASIPIGKAEGLGTASPWLSPNSFFPSLCLLPFSLGLWEAEPIHLSQRAWVRAVKFWPLSARAIGYHSCEFNHAGSLGCFPAPGPGTAQPACAGAPCHPSARAGWAAGPAWGPREDPNWG